MSYFPPLPPPPPYTPNAPSYPPQQSPQQQQYIPPGTQQIPAQYNQPLWNAPPTPAYTLSPYAPSYSRPQEQVASPTQYFPPPPQGSNPQNPGPVSYQPPPNAPPTPAYTPSSYTSPIISHQNSIGQSTQYFPYQQPAPTANNAPPAQYQQQVPRGNNSQSSQHQPCSPPLNAPPTPVSPSSYGSSEIRRQESIASKTESFTPAPTQVQSGQPQQPVGNNAQAAYYTPSTNAPQVLTPAQTPAASYGDFTQFAQNGYASEKQEYQQSQIPNAAVLGQHVPPSSQPNAPQPYVIPPQAPQNNYPQEKQQYVTPGQPAQNTNPQETQNYAVPRHPPHANTFPQDKQQYVVPGYPPENIYPQHQYTIPGQPPPQNIYPQQQPQQYPPQFVPQQTQQYPPLTVQQPFPTPLAHGGAPLPVKDDLKSSRTKRFLGDTLVGRAARSSVSTVTSTMKLPMYLSPWGDNNPVTLPNVRYRDAALFATFHVIGGPLVDGAANVIGDAFGADTFVAEIASSGAGFINGNTIVKYGVFQIVEQAIDKGILEHMLPEVEKTMRTTTVKSMQVSIKHKLMGLDADMRFVGEYPTTNATACDKGWFCPYLFASSREPKIPRSQDWAIAQCFNPYLAADTALARKLLAELPSVIPLCDPNPLARLPYARLLVLFTGISPFRANMWSTSRRPGCGQLFFHLLNGCVALVMPVTTAKTPVMAWSPWTLNQMQDQGASGYSPGTQHKQITDYLMDIVERPGLYPCVRDGVGAFERIMGRVVTMIINGALAAPRALDGKVFAKMDVERAGIVMFRY